MLIFRFLVIVILLPTISLSQTDTSQLIRVHFLYGSKPKWKHRSTEVHYFGGLHGGHVSIEVDSVDYGFEATIRPVHIFPHKKRKSHFATLPLQGRKRYGDQNKTVTFVIPVSYETYRHLRTINRCYADSTPYDYAFFGMRCASATYEILAKVGLVKQKRRFFNIVSNFYPKRLRKKLFRLAQKNNYTAISTSGKTTRRWERD